MGLVINYSRNYKIMRRITFLTYCICMNFFLNAQDNKVDYDKSAHAQIMKWLEASKEGTTTLSESHTAVLITDNELLIVSSSYRYQYVGSTYKPFTPDYAFYSNVLNTRQAQYDANLKKINGEWGKLMSLELINETHKTMLIQYKSTISKEIKTNCNGDLSDDSYANSWLTYISQVFNIETIRNEIILLQKINQEFQRLKNNNPDNFHKSVRYSEMCNALSLLKKCDIREINTISVKYGLI